MKICYNSALQNNKTLYFNKIQRKCISFFNKNTSKKVQCISQFLFGLVWVDL